MIQFLNFKHIIVPFILLISLYALILSGCAGTAHPEGWSGGVVTDDFIFIGTMEGQLIALDRFSGETYWKFNLRGEESQRAIYGTPAISNETLYIGGYDSILYALTTEGNLIWEERLDGPIVGSPFVAENLILVSSTDGHVYAFDKTEQSRKWRFKAKNSVWSGPIASSGIVYFGSLDHNVYALTQDDGDLLWTFSTNGAVTATPLVYDGHVYVGSFDGNFYAIDAKTGMETWRFDNANNWYWGSAIIHNETVFAPSLDGNLYALDIKTGKLLWTIETEGPIIGAPAIVFDMISVASQDGKIRFARLSNGLELDSCNIGEEIKTSVVAEGGFIYFGAQDNSIRALEIKKNSGNPDEVWVHYTNQDDPISRDKAKAC